MRNFVPLLVFFCLAGYTTKILYDKFIYSGKSFLEETYSYPDKITVENAEGSKIQITLMGRNSNYIEFKKKDSRKFIYPISSLSEKSQAMVMVYPDSGIGDASSYLSSGDMELKDVYTIQLEEEIRRIEAEVKALQARGSATQSQTESRTIERKVEALNKKISEIEYKITVRQ